MSVLGWRVLLRFERRRVMCSRCGGVRVENLEWLSVNPRYTQRLARQVGTLCREMSNKAVGAALPLDAETVKELDKQYMREELARHPVVSPRVIGIDELSIRRGHTYRVIVSDVERGRVIWVGGEGRKEADLDRFFAELGELRVKRIRLAVLDMWKPFRLSVQKNVPPAELLYDKFHILQHLGKALDEVRRMEYKRVAGQEREFIKGQRYTLLSHKENLNLAGRKALKKLLAANKRLNTA
jgi:transposase